MTLSTDLRAARALIDTPEKWRKGGPLSGREWDLTPTHCWEYTGSIDAALALVERKLAPTWTFGSLTRGYSAGDDPSPYYCVLVGQNYGGVPGDWSKRVEAVGETAPTSILLALLDALRQAQTEEGK